MSAFSNLGTGLSREIKSRAGWGIVLGILRAVLGLLLIANPLFAATVRTVFIGFFLVLAGILDVVQALRVHTIARLPIGAVYGFAGIVLLLYPLGGVGVLAVVLGVMLLFEAGSTAALALQVKPPGWGWLLVDAAITVILGFLILVRWPASSIWAIGTLVGLAVLLRGVMHIALCTSLRRVMGRVEELQARPPRAA